MRAFWALAGSFELGPLLGFDALGVGEGGLGHRAVLGFDAPRLRPRACATSPRS